MLFTVSIHPSRDGQLSRRSLRRRNVPSWLHTGRTDLALSPPVPQQTKGCCFPRATTGVPFLFGGLPIPSRSLDDKGRHARCGTIRRVGVKFSLHARRASVAVQTLPSPLTNSEPYPLVRVRADCRLSGVVVVCRCAPLYALGDQSQRCACATARKDAPASTAPSCVAPPAPALRPPPCSRNWSRRTACPAHKPAPFSRPTWRLPIATAGGHPLGCAGAGKATGRAFDLPLSQPDGIRVGSGSPHGNRGESPVLEGEAPRR
jgi:hypothetical protein